MGECFGAASKFVNFLATVFNKRPCQASPSVLRNLSFTEVKEGWSALQETKTLCPDVPGSTSQTLWFDEDGGYTLKTKKSKRGREGRCSSANEIGCQAADLKI